MNIHMESKYELNYLLDRVYDDLGKRSKTKASFTPPEVARHNRKTYVSNFNSVCESFGRDSSDVKIYIERELQATSSITGTGQLCIDGMFNQINIQKILSEYVKHFILCSHCKSKDTIIVKKDRIKFLVCRTCRAEKSISE